MRLSSSPGAAMRKSVHTRAYTILRERLVAARQAAGLSQAALGIDAKRVIQAVSKAL